MNDTQAATQGNMSLGRHKRSMHVLAVGLDFHQHKYSVNIKIRSECQHKRYQGTEWSTH